MNIKEEFLTNIKQDVENLKLRIDALPVSSPLRRKFEKQKENLESQLKPENHSTSPAVNNLSTDFVGDQHFGLVGAAASPDICTMINDDPTILTEEINIADPSPINPVGPIVSERPSTLDEALAEIERLKRVSSAEIDRLNRVSSAEIDRLNREVVRERSSSFIDGYLHAVNEMVSNVHPKDYYSATLLGLFPTQAINVYIGSSLRSMHDVLNNHSTAMTSYAVFAIQVCIGLILMVWVVHKARKELSEALLMEIDNNFKVIVEVQSS